LAPQEELGTREHTAMAAHTGDVVVMYGTQSEDKLHEILFEA